MGGGNVDSLRYVDGHPGRGGGAPPRVGQHENIDGRAAVNDVRDRFRRGRNACTDSNAPLPVPVERPPEVVVPLKIRVVYNGSIERDTLQRDR